MASTSTTTKLTVLPNSPSTYGTSLTFTAKVSSSGKVTGTVNFSVDGQLAGSGNLNNGGNAQYSTSLLPAGTHSITASYVANPPFDASSDSLSYTVNQVTPTITWSNPTAITYGTALSATQLNATASVPGTFAYSPAAGTVLSAGTRTLSTTFTPTDTTDYTTATNSVSLTVNKAVLTVKADNQSRPYGTANPTFTASYSGFVNQDTAATALTGSPSLSTTATTTSPVGNYPITVAVGSLAAANYSFTFVSGTLTVSKATPAITWSNPADITYGTLLSATQLNATASVQGTSVPGTLDYTPPAGTRLSAGSQTLSTTFTPTDTINYNPATKSVSLTVNKATATVTLGSLSQTYNGTPRNATATTSPTGLSVTFTYNGSSTAPTAVGNYTVVGTVNDTNYQGSATGTLVIGKGTATVTLGNLSQTYDGTAKSVTVTTDPAGLSGVSVTYDGSTTAPAAAGSYAVVASLNNANYAASDATGSLVIGSATATVTLGSLNQTYDGSPKAVTATTSPAGLSVSFTYSDSPNAPTEAGNYTVVGAINDPNYQGSATSTLAIAKADQTITFGPLTGKAYGDADFNVSATSTNPNLPVTFSASDNASVSGTKVHITGAGSATITASQAGDANHNAAADVARGFTIAKATPTVTVTGGSFTYDSMAHPATVSVSGVNGDPLSGTLSYTKADHATLAGEPIDAGTYTATGYYAGSVNYNSAQSSDTVTIAASPTATVLTSSSANNQSAYKESVTFTATVSAVAPGSGTPVGTVTFKDGNSTLASDVQLTKDNATGEMTATYTTSDLSVANHSITVTYGGATDFSPSTSDALIQAVGLAATTTTLISSLNPSSYGQPVTFTATVTVTSSGASVSSGTVTFYETGVIQPLGGAVLTDNGQATLNAPSPLSVGSHEITARYSGDDTYDVIESSPPLTQTVNDTQTASDTTAPTVTLTVINGPPKALDFRFHDAESGLDCSEKGLDISYGAGSNIVPLDDSKDFTGTNWIDTDSSVSPEVSYYQDCKVVITKADGNKQAQFDMGAHDRAGNHVTLDAYQSALIGGGTSHSFSVKQRNGFVTVQNNDFGIDSLTATVNGRSFVMAGLKPNELRQIDVRDAMAVGTESHISVAAAGATGSGAIVMVGPVKLRDAAPLVRGDANGDGTVDIADAVLLLRVTVGLEKLTPAEARAADLNGDDRIDVSDASALLRQIAHR